MIDQLSLQPTAVDPACDTPAQLEVQLAARERDLAAFKSARQQLQSHYLFAEMILQVKREISTASARLASLRQTAAR